MILAFKTNNDNLKDQQYEYPANMERMKKTNGQSMIVT